MDENIKRLEEKIAYLERHVTEQDKAMLEMADDIAALKRAVERLRGRAQSADLGGSAEDAADERPPHY